MSFSDGGALFTATSAAYNERDRLAADAEQHIAAAQHDADAGDSSWTCVTSRSGRLEAAGATAEAARKRHARLRCQSALRKARCTDCGHAVSKKQRALPPEQAGSDSDGVFDEAAATRDAKMLKVAELRAALEAAGADTEGLKAELVERLVTARRARLLRAAAAAQRQRQRRGHR